MRPTLLLLLAVAFGCSDDGGAADSDAGLPPGADGGVFGDAGPSPAADAGMESPAEGEPLPTAPDYDLGSRFEGADDGAGAGSCFDGEDNDRGVDASEPDGIDCEDADCASLRSCCVGRATCCEPIAAPIGFAAGALAGCDDLEACLPEATPFGDPAPFLDGDPAGLGLAGDSEYDSGLHWDATTDLRTEAVSVEATFQPPGDCGSTCLESVAFGFTEQQGLADREHVEPLVALVASGARSEVRLLADGAEIARWDEPATGPVRWTLRLAPTGALEVEREDELLLARAGGFRPAAAHLVAWGHSRNPSASDPMGARLEELAVTVERCDMPRAWSAREPVELALAGALTFDPADAASPSVARDLAGRLTLAFLHQGDLFVAKRPSEAEPARFLLTTARDEPALPDPGSGPELVEADDGFWLYTAGPEGIRRRTMDDAAEVFGDAEPVLSPVPLGALQVDAPTVAEVPATTSRPERWAMVVRADETRLVAVASTDGRSWRYWSEVPASLLNVDAIGEPSLSVGGGVYQLHVAVRRGTRWREALFVSDELLYWRLVDEAALGPDALPSDRVGVRAGDAVVGDGEVEVFHLGLDGQRTTLQRAVRPLPTPSL
ncbi:MAG TPA: hypothetical protein RMH85_08755 [Polyangiaceae bacterium LLY-WYZ-15_(1-7)]|nr:hypothetical protein [Sandaracinus sp.]HJL01408.1 hypothetical protein [Polyangiaceae bacterium LLY-WYZ-15_(1-7)]HJL08573.1 hypothetical protein [Polyangiaceae bacterium LLY-WYZ-15_(1-7)]HJL45218.1 hypothetical protein [Polyangiaceae bacterium LLY-WYZ-15_(1-7)]